MPPFLAVIADCIDSPLPVDYVGRSEQGTNHRLIVIVAGEGGAGGRRHHQQSVKINKQLVENSLIYITIVRAVSKRCANDTM